ncbi:hypothetical protein [Granulicella arctica]|uniref:hypothetical protein n=1 Tax=Granulicella arctica TaxID=940613 RepID=UPI0021DFBF07|nr:hypothetical protein [Granulicella arctica]
MLRWLPLLLTVISVSAVPAISPPQAEAESGILQRRYAEGSVLHYLMTGNNDGRQYTILATDIVKRDANRRYYEEVAWSGLTSNEQQALTLVSLAMRQTLSLDDPATYLKVPDLSNVQPLMIGPITDTLTFYSDLLLATKAQLVQPGQSTYVARTAPNSWADGQRVLLGQDVVDFSLKVDAVDPVEHTETLLIQHLPPPALHVQLPAKWMEEPTSVKPNNFVQISRQNDEFVAETGKETFDVRLTVDTRDGHIVSAAMHNPVVLRVRTCKDRQLTQCDPETSKTILREITWKLVP